MIIVGLAGLDNAQTYSKMSKIVASLNQHSRYRINTHCQTNDVKKKVDPAVRRTRIEGLIKGCFHAANKYTVLIVYPLVDGMDAAAVRDLGGTVWHVGRPCDVPFFVGRDLFCAPSARPDSHKYCELDALSESRFRQNKNYLSTLGIEGAEVSQ